MQEKDFNKIEVQNNICINVFGYENKLVSISDQTRRVAKGWGGGRGEGREDSPSARLKQVEFVLNRMLAFFDAMS